MDLVKLLEISNPKGLRSIINTVIEEHNQNVKDVNAVKQQIESTVPDALADRYTKSEVQALLEANKKDSDTYTNAKIATLIDSAPETLDTFAEIAAAFAEDQAVLDALNSAIGLKVNKTELDNYYTKTASDALLNNKYVKPSAGIPKTDLASAVQDSLDKADSALQALPEFKTINNESILGSGNIEVAASGGGGSADGILSLPVGSIFTSAIPLTDSAFHLLDGTMISQTGIYADFSNLLKSLVAAGYAISCTLTEYNTDITNTGNCGKFVIDDTAGTIKLPTITKFIEGLSNLTDIGKSLQAGLPNITGNVGPMGRNDDYTKVYNGAFKNSTVKTDNYVGTNSSSGSVLYPVNFDASQSNAIYGRSSEVQPNATRYPYYIVLANSYKSKVALDADNILQEVNTRADNILQEVYSSFLQLSGGKQTITDIKGFIKGKGLVDEDNINVIRENVSSEIEVGNTSKVLLLNGSSIKLNKAPTIGGLDIRRSLGINKTADWGSGVQESPITVSTGGTSSSYQAGNYGTVVAAINTVQTEGAQVEIQMSSDNGYFKRVAYFYQNGYASKECVSYFIPPKWYFRVVCSSKTGAQVYYSKLNGGAFPSNA